MSKNPTKTEPPQEQKTVQCYITTKDGQKHYFDISMERAKMVLRLQKRIREERAEKLKNKKKALQK